MCTGAEIALIAAAAAGTGSAIYSGQQQEKLAEYQAAQSEADANTEKQAAQIRGDKIRERAKSQAASIRASLAASGVSLDSVTANMINKDVIQGAEEDALIGINDASDAAGRLRAQAGVLRIQGRNAKIAGYAKGASSALSAYSGSQGGWYGGQR